MLITMDRLRAEYGVSPKRVLHVGAHLGEEAADYAASGVRDVLWVEANPELMAGLRAHLAAFPGQAALQAAVSDADGEPAVLHVAQSATAALPSMCSSLLPPKAQLRIYPFFDYSKTIALETVTLDTLLAREGLDPGGWDLLNLDVEGGELRVLRGAPRALAGAAWVFTEVNHAERFAGGALLPEMDTFLHARGFVRLRLQDFPDGTWGEALYGRLAR